MTITTTKMILAVTRIILRMPAPIRLKALILTSVSRHVVSSCHFTVRTQYGFRVGVQIDDMIGRLIYYFGVWEPVATTYMVNALRHGDVVVDVGAHQGWYTLLASRSIGLYGQVIAIEASSIMCSKLRENLALNRITNVDVVHAAAWRREEVKQVYPGPDRNTGLTSLYREWLGSTDSCSETVIGIPLDRLVPANIWHRIRFVKIDVEGAEWEVISGMHLLLASLRYDAEILLEMTPAFLATMGMTVPQVLAPFRARGFNVYEIANEYTLEFYLALRANIRLPRPRRVWTAWPKSRDVILTRIDSEEL